MDDCNPLQVGPSLDSVDYLILLYCRARMSKGAAAVFPVDIGPNVVARPASGTRKLQPPGRIAPGASPKELSRIKAEADKFRRALTSAALLTHFGYTTGHPRWALGVHLQQTWTRTVSKLGAITSVAPVGLHPGTRQIVATDSLQTTQKSSQSASTESVQSTELTSNTQWSDKTRRQLSLESNAEVQPAATVNSITGSAHGVTVGVGGDLGIKGNFDSKTADVVEQSRDNLADQTLKSASSLKRTQATSFETTVVSNRQTQVTDTLYNPNRGNTLNYIYREAIETYRIDTAFERLDLVLFVPLPMESNFEDAWILANECYLRPHMSCETLAAAFDAVKAEMKLGQLSE
jgi:hypothetical protein